MNKFMNGHDCKESFEGQALEYFGCSPTENFNCAFVQETSKDDVMNLNKMPVTCEQYEGVTIDSVNAKRGNDFCWSLYEITIQPFDPASSCRASALTIGETLHDIKKERGDIHAYGIRFQDNEGLSTLSVYLCIKSAK